MADSTIFEVGFLVFLLLAGGVSYTVRELKREYAEGDAKKKATDRP